MKTKIMVLGRRSFALSSLAAVLALVILAVGLASVMHFVHSSKLSKTPITASQSTKGETTSSSSSTKSPSASSSPPGTTKGGVATDTSLIQPTGVFVSAHHNVPLTAALSSVCNTSSGAKCQIVFTSGSQTHSLPAQTTDLGGATYWNNWTPASIGLTPGSWQIKAIASLGSQTQTSTDALNLEVVQ